MSTYCFDLDGTLCTNTNGKYEEAQPFENRIKLVNEMHDLGHKIIIDTARGATTGINWFDLTMSQLEKWGVKYHNLRVGTKFNADFYVDDKGLRPEDLSKE